MEKGYSSESTQGELSNEFQDDRLLMVFKKLCVHVLWMKAATELEGLTPLMLDEHSYYLTSPGYLISERGNKSPFLV